MRSRVKGARHSRWTRVLRAAKKLVAGGWSVVPVPAGGKAPKIKNWPKLRLGKADLEEAFKATDNIGVLLGEASDGLVDVDLDSKEAIRAARYSLPETNLTHGRPSKRSSHCWYQAKSVLRPTKFCDTDGAVILECRGDGQQTLVPPSEHTSGEPYEWERTGSPARVEGPALSKTVSRLAACALAARHWPQKGSRHETALALAGFLLRNDWSREEAENFVTTAAFASTTDEEWKSRKRNVQSTLRRLTKGEPATGLPKLAALLGDDVVSKLTDWLDISPEGQTTSKAGADPLPPDDWRREPLRGTWAVRLAEHFFQDYLILPTGIPFVAALWTIATYAFEQFDCFPYLAITSPTKRCGKTRFGEILELLCCRSTMSCNVSEAALFRSIASEKPTLIIDEAESLQRKDSDRSRNILAILQAGFKQGASVPRCVGSEYEVKKFPVFCPKAVLGIGNFPDTLTDRSIVVSMRRRLRDQHVGRFRRRVASRQAEGIVNAIETWTDAHKYQIYKSYVGQKLDFLRDREADIWEPLFAIASVAVPERLEELKDVANHLSDQKTKMDVDDTQGLRLLEDIRTVFAGTKLKSISSADLVDRVRRELATHWDEDLTQTKLSRLLRPFGISSQQIWLGERNVRGYRREDFKSAFARYLEPERC